MTVPTKRSGVPLPAAVLGLSGLIPFWTCAIGLWFVRSEAGFLLSLQLTYAAVILSFMGAIRWALTMVDTTIDGAEQWRRYGGSVLPPLIGWVALQMPVLWSLAVLALAFALVYAADLAAVRKGWAPGWYPRLRTPLTIMVIGSLAVSAGAVLRG